MRTSSSYHHQHPAYRRPMQESNKTMVIIAWVAILSGWILMPIGPIVAVIVSYIGRRESQDLAAHSHFNKVITIFWFGWFISFLSIAVILFYSGYLPFGRGNSAVVGGFFFVAVISIALSLYCTFAAIKGIIKTSNGRPYS